MIKLQGRGPFTIAGDPIRTDLSLRVARILEARGFATVVFLMDEGVDDMREELMVLQKGNKLSSSILKTCFFEDDMRQVSTNGFERVFIVIIGIQLTSDDHTLNQVRIHGRVVWTFRHENVILFKGLEQCGLESTDVAGASINRYLKSPSLERRTA